MSLLSEIKEKRNELDKLERQYLKETLPCCNTNCSFWRENTTGRCNWSVLLEDCQDYKDKFDDTSS